MCEREKTKRISSYSMTALVDIKHRGTQREDTSGFKFSKTQPDAS